MVTPSNVQARVHPCWTVTTTPSLQDTHRTAKTSHATIQNTKRIWHDGLELVHGINNKLKHILQRIELDADNEHRSKEKERQRGRKQQTNSCSARGFVFVFSSFAVLGEQDGASANMARPGSTDKEVQGLPLRANRNFRVLQKSGTRQGSRASMDVRLHSWQTR